MRAITVLVAAAALALAACGDDAGSGSEPAPTGDSLQLTSRLSESSNQIATLDVDLAREQLGVPGDTDPAYAPGEGLEELDFAQRRLKALFDMVVGGTLSGLSDRSERLRDAFDMTQVQAATSVITRRGEERTVALRTQQPYGEVAAALEAEGYERDGALLVDELADEALESVYLADAGDGTIVLTTARPRAEAVAAGEDAVSDAMLTLLDGTEGALRVATEPTRPLPEAECVRAVAVGENAGPPYAGELVLDVRGGASPDRFTPPDPSRGSAATRLAERIELGQPRAEGDALTVPFRFTSEPDPDGAATGLIFAALREAGTGTLYDCE